ncbi:MAG: hypothetical protein M3P37_05520 [Actinomycetota bacterium]|nr:hypothetical protein [Actinomycetota bacterium]
MEGGGGEADHAGEQVREEPLGVAQQRTLALDAAKLLQERQGQDLGVREPLERRVSLPSRVEDAVGVVYEAEERDRGVFRSGEAWGKVGSGHFLLLVEGSRMALFLLPVHATLI